MGKEGPLGQRVPKGPRVLGPVRDRKVGVNRGAEGERTIKIQKKKNKLD